MDDDVRPGATRKAISTYLSSKSLEWYFGLGVGLLVAAALLLLPWVFVLWRGITIGQNVCDPNWPPAGALRQSYFPVVVLCDPEKAPYSAGESNVVPRTWRMAADGLMGLSIVLAVSGLFTFLSTLSAAVARSFRRRSGSKQPAGTETGLG